MDKRGKIVIASSEIMILIVATFAFAYLISSVGVVSAEQDDKAKPVVNAVAQGTLAGVGALATGVVVNSGGKLTEVAKKATSGETETPSAKKGGLGSVLGNIYGFNESGTSGGSLSNAGTMDSLVSSAAWGVTAGGIAYGAAYFLTDNQATRNAAGAAIGAGFFVGRLANTMFGVGGLGSFLIGGGVALAIFLLINVISREFCLAVNISVEV